jgi:hypothetical protein
MSSPADAGIVAFVSSMSEFVEAVISTSLLSNELAETDTAATCSRA